MKNQIKLQNIGNINNKNLFNIYSIKEGMLNKEIFIKILFSLPLLISKNENTNKKY